MKKIEKQLETFLYGAFSLAFAAAFFFGVLYPGYGISPKAYKETEVKQEQRVRERKVDIDELFYPEKRKIRCRSYFYDRLKNS